MLIIWRCKTYFLSGHKDKKSQSARLIDFAKKICNVFLIEHMIELKNKMLRKLFSASIINIINKKYIWINKEKMTTDRKQKKNMNRE